MSRLGWAVAGTVRVAVAVALAGAAVPADASRLIQNTSTGVVSSGTRVPCNDPGGFTHWITPNVNWMHNTANQGSGKGGALARAMASWTAVAGADHAMALHGTSSATFDGNDGVNAISWGTGNGCANTCLALTHLRLQAGQEIVEADITFNDDVTWATDGTDNDTEGVAAHELGHALGIHHTELNLAAQPTMFAFYFGTAERSLEQDDRDALVCSQNTYPPPATAPVTPLRFTVTSALCFGLNDLDWGPSAGATRYEVYRSPNQAFNPQTLHYSGSGLGTTINVTGTTYLRVRACNAAGCSGYRTGNRAARPTQGCF